MQFTRREWLGSAAALAAVGGAAAVRGEPAGLVLDDASRLNPTPIARAAAVRGGDPVAQLRGLLAEAAREGRAFCLGGARHSMGGQSLPLNGVAATLTATGCEVDQGGRTYRIGAGTSWRDVIAALDPLGLSPAVMQSNHDFSVGGAMSVNAHGWPVAYGPVGATVRSFRLMLADGTVLTCSREQNAELFGLCLGGYGLFGVILDVELDAAPNLLVEPTHEVLPAARFAERFGALATAPDVRLCYGRLSLSRDDFLEEAILVAYRPTAEQPERLPAAGSVGPLHDMAKAVFRGQTGSEAGKRRRWRAETLAARLSGAPVTRNTLLNAPVSFFAGGDPQRTDILHEYFVAPTKLEAFLAACRGIIPRFAQDLLNVTVRYVDADRDAVLAFAPEPRVALVMLFSQPMTARDEADMRALTEALIDAALEQGGSFYLPYRLHARPDQLGRAYPRLDAFLAAKRRWDPDLRFRNRMWDGYFGAPEQGIGGV